MTPKFTDNSQSTRPHSYPKNLSSFLPIFQWLIWICQQLPQTHCNGKGTAHLSLLSVGRHPHSELTWCPQSCVALMPLPRSPSRGYNKGQRKANEDMFSFFLPAAPGQSFFLSLQNIKECCCCRCCFPFWQSKSRFPLLTFRPHSKEQAGEYSST